jgi:hypothetical protein
VLDVKHRISTWVFLGCSPHDFVIVRHCHSERSGWNEQRFAAQLTAACEEFQSTPYPETDALLEASTIPTTFRPLVGSGVLWCWGRREIESPTSGLFCSQLVIEVFRKLDIDLFPGRLGHHVSPKMLAAAPELVPLDPQPFTLDEVSGRKLLGNKIEWERLRTEWEERRTTTQALTSMKVSLDNLDLMNRELEETRKQREKKNLSDFEQTVRNIEQMIQRDRHEAARYKYSQEVLVKFSHRLNTLAPLGREYLRNPTAAPDEKLDAFFDVLLLQVCYLRYRFIYLMRFRRRLLTYRLSRTVRIWGRWLTGRHCGDPGHSPLFPRFRRFLWRYWYFPTWGWGALAVKIRTWERDLQNKRSQMKEQNKQKRNRLTETTGQDIEVQAGQLDEPGQ